MATVIVRETPQDVQICLLLPLNETSAARPTFVALLRALLTAPQNLDSLSPLAALSGALPSRRRRSVESAVQLVSPARPESLEKLLKGLATTGGGRLGRVVANISRNLADLLGVEEETISEFLAATSGQSVGEVHAQLALPIVGIVKGASTVIEDDAKRAAARGDVEDVTRIRRRLDSLTLVSLIPGQAAAIPGQMKAINSLKRRLDQLAKTAEKVRNAILGGR